MNKAVLLRLHRWISLVFALPLLVVIGTGLVLSFQPIAQSVAVVPGSLTAERLDGMIRQHDPAGKARGLVVNARDGVLTLAGVGPDGEIDVDLASGAETERETFLSDLFSSARRLHQRLVFGMGWLVTASTVAMLVLAALGVLMGLPRLRNDLGGWHRGMAWFTLPLVILSPLTGLMLAFNFNPGAPSGQRARAAPLSLIEATRLVASSRDPATILSIGTRGGRMMARVLEGGETRAYSLTRDGLSPLPRGWPRLIHEGVWNAWIAGGLNILTSLVSLGLLGTGLVIWARRSLRMRGRRAALAAPASTARSIA